MSLIKKITTVVEEEFNGDVIIKRTTTTTEEQFSQDLNWNPTIFPTYPTYPWQNPIIYGDSTGNPVPNYVTVTCELAGQENTLGARD